MTNILFFAYPMYADFEIAHTLFFLKKLGKANLITATIDGKVVESLGGIRTTPDLSISEADPTDFDLILISGGDGVSEVVDDIRIHNFLQQANTLHKPIASICASATILGKAGLLKENKFTCTANTYEMFKEVFVGAEYSGERIEVQDNIITAKGTAFPEFTLAVLDQLLLWKNNEQRESAYLFSKGEV